MVCFPSMLYTSDCSHSSLQAAHTPPDLIVVSADIFLLKSMLSVLASSDCTFQELNMPRCSACLQACIKKQSHAHHKLHIRFVQMTTHQASGVGSSCPLACYINMHAFIMLQRCMHHKLHLCFCLQDQPLI